MEQTTETMMATIKENTGHPIEHWIEIIRKSGIHDHNDIVEFLVRENEVSPRIANFLAETAKGNEHTH